MTIRRPPDDEMWPHPIQTWLVDAVERVYGMGQVIERSQLEKRVTDLLRLEDGARNPLIITNTTGDATLTPGRTICYSPEVGRIGDQLRDCCVCDKRQPVDDFNLCLDVMTSSGEHGDAEDSYVCDTCAPDVVRAIKALRPSRPPSGLADEDLLCEDA